MRVDTRQSNHQDHRPGISIHVGSRGHRDFHCLVYLSPVLSRCAGIFVFNLPGLDSMPLPQGVFPIVVIDYHALEGRLKVSWIVIRSPGGADIRVVQAAIDFGLKKHFSVAKRIVFAREKVFFVVQKIGFVTETIGLARSAIISVPVSIGFGLKKHFSVAKRIVFAGEKTFVVVQKIRFVTEMI